MNKFHKIGLTILAVVFVTGSVSALTIWNESRLHNRYKATVGGYTTGSPEELGQLTVETNAADIKGVVIKGYSGQSVDYLQIVNSSGTELYSVDSSGDMDVAGMNVEGDLNVEGGVTIDNASTDTVGLTVQSYAGQVVNMLTVQDEGAATDFFEVEYDGDVKVNAGDFSVTGDTTLTGTTAIVGAATVSTTLGVTTDLTVSGNTVLGNATADTITCNTGLKPVVAGADPCATLAPLTMFMSSGSDGLVCFCNANGVDLLIDGSSNACTY